VVEPAPAQPRLPVLSARLPSHCSVRLFSRALVVLRSSPLPIRYPYSPTGPPPQLPCASAAWARDLENQISRQRLDGIQILLRFRVQLTEYYNFGRIEPGRHGCFFGLENGHLRPPSIIFSRCAALVKASAPYGARGNLH